MMSVQRKNDVANEKCRDEIEKKFRYLCMKNEDFLERYIKGHPSVSRSTPAVSPLIYELELIKRVYPDMDYRRSIAGRD